MSRRAEHVCSQIPSARAKQPILPLTLVWCISTGIWNETFRQIRLLICWAHGSLGSEWGNRCTAAAALAPAPGAGHQSGHTLHRRHRHPFLPPAFHPLHSSPSAAKLWRHAVRSPALWERVLSSCGTGGVLSHAVAMWRCHWLRGISATSPCIEIMTAFSCSLPGRKVPPQFHQTTSTRRFSAVQLLQAEPGTIARLSAAPLAAPVRARSSKTTVE